MSYKRIPKNEKYKWVGPKNAPERFLAYLKRITGEKYEEVISKAIYAVMFAGQLSRQEKAIVALAAIVKQLGMDDAILNHYLIPKKQVLELVELSKKPIREIADRKILAIKTADIAPKDIKKFYPHISNLDQQFKEYLEPLYEDFMEIGGI